MKIMIAGLGLIGGSMAKSLKRAGYSADGADRPAVCEKALQAGAIASVARDTAAYDVVFIALPPDAAMDFIRDSSFAEGAVVADICRVCTATVNLEVIFIFVLRVGHIFCFNYIVYAL